MLEIYVISQKSTQKILNYGRVNIARDQEWIDKGDTSTAYGAIQNRLNNDPGLQVLYLPNTSTFPDQETQKINSNNTAIVKKTKSDLAKEELEKEIAIKQIEITQLEKLVDITTKLQIAKNNLAILQAQAQEVIE